MTRADWEGAVFMNSWKDLAIDGKFCISRKLSYQSAKERICIRVLNRGHNRSRLEKLPFVAWEDLAIVFFFDTGGAEEIPITAEDLERWELDLYELYRNALVQSRRIHPPLFATMREVLGIPENEWEEEIPLYVLTCRKPFYGSAVMFYPGMMAYLSERIGGDLYVIPCSVHELILVRRQKIDDPEGLHTIIRRVNREELLWGDVLSDSLYEYLEKEDVLRRADSCENG